MKLLNFELYLGYTLELKKMAPLLNNTIEMRSFWTELKCIQIAATLLDKNWVN